MDTASLYYLGVTFALFLVFAVIVFRTYDRKRKEELEAPKHRMLNDEED